MLTMAVLWLYSLWLYSTHYGCTVAILTMAHESSMPEAMSCGSEARLPSRERAEREYAEIMQCSMRICCCCTVETSVQWPW